MNALERFLYFFCFPVFSLSFILLPLTNDARIYLGAAAQADYFGGFPQGLDIAWEIKPVGNRLIAYLLYHIGQPFGDDAHYIIRAVVLMAIIAIAWYASKQFKTKYTFLLIFFSLTTCANFCMFQAEYFSVLLSFLCIALILSDNKWCNYAAGPVMLWVFLCKGITGVFVIPIIISVILLKKDWVPNIKRFVVSCMVSGMLYFIACLTIFQNSIPDMILSKSLARVGIYPILRALDIATFMGGTIYLYIPVILIGAVAGILLLYSYYGAAKFWLILGLWCVPVAMIFLQGEFFVYHYLTLVIPSVISIVAYERGL